MSSNASPSDLILRDTLNHVTTLTMNMPARLNGWTMGMMQALKTAMSDAAADEQTKVLVLTGTGKYYCAGVNLGSTLRLEHPRALHAAIVKHNQGLFDQFLDFPKPILVAANGPAIGAAVTSATLCDGIIASERATFSTPFAVLGVPPEGCSSVVFPELLGESADRILGEEGWKPTGTEAEAIGLVQWVVPHSELMEEAQRIAETWVADGKQRSYRAGGGRDTLKAVNARESINVADAFLSPPFLRGQFEFLWRKNKRGPAVMFLALWLSHPLWSTLLPPSSQP